MLHVDDGYAGSIGGKDLGHELDEIIHSRGGGGEGLVDGHNTVNTFLKRGAEGGDMGSHIKLHAEVGLDDRHRNLVGTVEKLAGRGGHAGLTVIAQIDEVEHAVVSADGGTRGVSVLSHVGFADKHVKITFMLAVGADKDGATVDEGIVVVGSLHSCILFG